MSMSERAALRRWTHAGLDCAAIDSGIGFINGYVRIPDEHVARTATYDQINRAISVHGGLTYGTDADGWVGFDTGHSGDKWPGLTSKYDAPATNWGREWDVDLLTKETESLAEQIAALTAIPMPTDPYSCTEDEFHKILRQAKAWQRIKGWTA